MSEPIYLAGPTAVGKTMVSLELAELTNAEIISVDSMLVYRGLDIGTAKPTGAERERVRHHLLDVAELTEPFDIARFCELAVAARQEVESRGKRALFCGGTGLYFNALLRGLDESAGGDARVRQAVEETPVERLLEELLAGDSAMYEQIDKNNPRRIIRAVEMLRTGNKPSEVRKKKRPAQAPFLFVLTRATTQLHERINRRVDLMFEQGLVNETATLLRHGLRENRTAMQALGYRQVIEHLEGERSLEETVERVKARTRQFARRQLTWFRGQFDARWWELAPDEDAKAVAVRIRDYVLSVEGA